MCTFALALPTKELMHTFFPHTVQFEESVSDTELICGSEMTTILLTVAGWVWSWRRKGFVESEFYILLPKK